MREGCELHLFLRHPPNWRLKDIQNDVAIHHGDLRDEAAVSSALREARPDDIFHLAAYGAYESQDSMREAFSVNVTGGSNLLEAATRRGFESFIQAGSSSEYGLKDHAPVEDENTEPNSYYAVTKDCMTRLLAYESRKQGFKATTLRLYSVYGPLEEPTRLISTLIREGLKGGYPPLASPETARDFVYVDDVCDAFVRASKSEKLSSVYNIGSGVQTRLCELAQLSQEIFSIPSEPAWGDFPDRKWDTTSWRANPEKANRELDWRAETKLRDGLLKTAEWMRSR